MHPPTITIQPAGSEHLLETARIYIECQETDFPFLPRAYTHGRDPQTERAESQEWLSADPQSSVFVALHGARMAGYTAVSHNSGPFPEYAGEINNLFVRPAYRGLGLGAQLMACAACYLQSIGCDRLLLYTLAQGASDAFYRHMGGRLLEQITQHFAGQPHPVDIFGYDIAALLARCEQTPNPPHLPPR